MTKSTMRIATLLVAFAGTLSAPAPSQAAEQSIRDLRWDCATGKERACSAMERINDRVEIAERYSLQNRIVLDILTPTEACIKYPLMAYLNDLSWFLMNLDGVVHVDSLVQRVKLSSAGWNGGNLKWAALPRNSFALVQAVGPVPPSTGFLNQNCSTLPIHIYTEDRDPETFRHISAEIARWQVKFPRSEVAFRVPKIYRHYDRSTQYLVVSLAARDDTIWSQDFFQEYKDITDDIFFLPGVARHTVTSLWTPNTRYLEITEEGIRAADVIPGTVTSETMDEAALAQIENNVIRADFVGRLVADDFSAAMITAVFLDTHPRTGQQFDNCRLIEQLEGLAAAYSDGRVLFEIVRAGPDGWEGAPVVCP